MRKTQYILFWKLLCWKKHAWAPFLLSHHLEGGRGMTAGSTGTGGIALEGEKPCCSIASPWLGSRIGREFPAEALFRSMLFKA